MTDTEQTHPAITSDQKGIHPDLAGVVQRHLATKWRKPVPDHTRRAGDTLMGWLHKRDKPLLLDSFCGTGMSTAQLAAAYPDHAVVGVDKSAARLARHGPVGDYLLLRAECEPLWRLLAEACVQTARHTLLYPNPWPKGAQLKRRIHGHPGFPWLLRLGGVIEVRSNWRTYIDEFAAAMQQAGVSGRTETISPAAPLTLFERKYQQRGEALWRWHSERPLLAMDRALR